MNEAANRNQLFHNSLSNRGSENFSSPKRLLRRKSFTSKNTILKAEESKKQTADFLIAGAGCGTLLWEFIGFLSTFAPMVMVSAMEILDNEDTAIDVLERCTDSWLVRTNDVEPLIAAVAKLPKCYNGHNVSTDTANAEKIGIGHLQSACFDRGAWLSSYCFFIHGLSHGLKESETFVAVSNYISSYNPSGLNTEVGCARHEYKLIPLLCLLIDLMLAEATRTDLSDVFIIERLSDVCVKLTKIVDEKGGLGAMTSNFIGRIIGSNKQVTSGEVPKFKIMAYALASFFCLNTTKVNLRVGQTDMPLNILTNTHCKGVAPACVKTLAEIGKIDSHASWANSFITNPDHNLKHANALVNGLSSRLYPNMLWLCRDKNEYRNFPPSPSSYNINTSKGVNL
mmetsp:Transcript_16918/g.20872  ORF Transcript_16918/g.20872 Transcript_16918/m.20872 type:complete len:397 (+) Transcript_16918:1-1191(+)